MKTGLKIRNDRGTVIIDNEYSNFKSRGSTLWIDLVFKGSLSGVGLNPGSLTTEKRLLFIRPEAGTFGIGFQGYQKLGGSISGANAAVSRNAGSIVFSYKTYFISTPQNIPKKYGLRVYGDGGKITYESTYTYLNIVEIYKNISLSSPTDTEEASGTFYDVSHPAVENPYYLLFPSGYWVYTAGGFRRTWNTGFRKLSSTSSRVKWLLGDVTVDPDSYNNGINPSLTLVVAS